MHFCFSNSARKTMVEKLNKLGFTPSTSPKTVNFQRLTAFVTTTVSTKNQTHLLLSVMHPNQAGTELLIKYAILIHLVFVEGGEGGSEDKVGTLLSELLSSCEMRQKKGDVEARKTGPADQNRQKLFLMERVAEKLLLSEVLKPYLGYLMRLVATRDDSLPASDLLQPHHAWKIINSLRMIGCTTNSFTTIGRYFKANYGHLVVLLTRTLSRDIHPLVQAFRQFIQTQRSRVERGEARTQEILETVELLEEFAKIKEQLLMLYFGKYFCEEVKDLAEPPWINCNETQFDSLFKVYRSQAYQCR